MKVLGKLFTKKKEIKTYPKNSEFKLCIINDDTNTLYENLGITDERCKELTRITLRCLEKHDTTTGVLNEIYGHCKHINEVTMVLFIYHKITESRKIHNIGGMLKNLFE
ncbi:MAG: hypothetical protein NTY55_02905 [Flavobacteriia bacterium]|nr:hypothetical protein [Flavobacteriia bacterium]